jgi:hypothetical protein
MRNFSSIRSVCNGRSTISTLAAFLLLAAAPWRALGQDSTNSIVAPAEGYFADWFNRVNRIQAEQPHWITPLVTVTPRLEEEVRYDQSWETTDTGSHLETFGGKGLELIPIDNVELILGVPAWLDRDKPVDTDGFADDMFLFKYRLAAANEQNGNYIVTAFLGVQTPTGNEKDTKHHWMITPTIAAGKGWGDFDVQSTLGITIPDTGAARAGAGTALQLNTTFQYRVLKTIWPELEVNYTYWPDGEHTGKNQVFMTPGIILGRFPIWERVGFTIGLGYQIALNDNPTYNHNVILSARLPF